jgi:hypothetical protein
MLYIVYKYILSKRIQKDFFVIYINKIMTNFLNILMEKCSNELFTKNLKIKNNCEKLEKAT